MGVGGGSPSSASIGQSVTVNQSASWSVNQSINLPTFFAAEQALLFPLTSTLSPSLSFFLALPLGSPLLEEECAIFEIPFGIPGLRAP